MKINLEDIQSVEKNPLDLFYDGLRADSTKDRYTRILRHILCDVFEDVLQGTFEERASQFVREAKSKPDWAMSAMLSLSSKVKERTKLPKTDKNYYNPSSFGNYFKPLKKLLDMNGVAVVWKRIYATYPEIDNQNRGRGYTREEIQLMIKSTTSTFNKAVILVASSSGIREGAFTLKWKDVMPVYMVDGQILLETTESQEQHAKVICAILQIYSNTSEYYAALITPEAYSALLEYRLTWAREVGREPQPSDPMFKVEGNVPIMCTPVAIKRHVERLLARIGLRHELPKGMRRHEVPIMNGFRRFFNKVNKEAISRDSPLAALIKKEYMMAHTGLVKLDVNYFHSHVLELVEEYLNAVPTLTIDDAERLKNQNNIKDAKIKEMESEKDGRMRAYEEKNAILERKLNGVLKLLKHADEKA